MIKGRIFTCIISLTELFEAFQDDERFHITELNTVDGIEYRVVFDILDHEDIFTTGKYVNFGYSFTFNPDTSDLIKVEGIWDGGLNMLGYHMYFEFVD